MAQACATVKTHRLLVSATSVFAIDSILLVTMLIGLLRHSHRGSIGIWHLLYTQVTLNLHRRSAWTLKALFEVHHLDDLGGNRGDTGYGIWLFSIAIFPAFTPVLSGFSNSRLQWYVSLV